jgi:alpha-galactosidase
MLISLLVPVLAGVPGALGLQRSDGVGRLPALGWNSWNV